MSFVRSVKTQNLLFHSSPYRSPQGCSRDVVEAAEWFPRNHSSYNSSIFPTPCHAPNILIPAPEYTPCIPRKSCTYCIDHLTLSFPSSSVLHHPQGYSCVFGILHHAYHRNRWQCCFPACLMNHPISASLLSLPTPHSPSLFKSFPSWSLFPYWPKTLRVAGSFLLKLKPGGLHPCCILESHGRIS